jgi:uncharacterized protein with von Willebrand factor type A (vWA) domain
MDKKTAAARFFDQLGQGSNDFITQMIGQEMDAELIELFNQLGGQLQMGEMDMERFQTSLLIIGYLVRAHEEAMAEVDEEEEADLNEPTGSVVH